jgi:hypothetical protein
VEYSQCNNSSSNTCRQRTTFHSERSTSYVETGLDNIPLGDYGSLLINATKNTGIWGKDNVYLGNDAGRDLGLASQYVVGVTTLDFFVGSFGLAVGAVSSNGTSQGTLLSSLFAAGVSPSYSVSYTAGSATSRLS